MSGYRNPIRLMALQAPRVPAFGGSAPGGEPEITEALSSALCAGLPRSPYLAARVAWTGDRSSCAELCNRLWTGPVALEVSRRKWPVPKGKERYRRLCALAVAELLEPARFRSNCARADFCGMSARQWSRSWAGRYEVCYCLLGGWVADSFRHLVAAQRNGGVDSA